MQTKLVAVGMGLLMLLAGTAHARPAFKKKPEFKPQILKAVDFSQGKSSHNRKDATAVERAETDNMYGGWARYDVYDDFDDIFGFDITSPTEPYDLNTSSLLYDGNHKICAAAWDGRRIHFISEIYYADYDQYTIGYRGILDPLTGQLQLLSKTGYASRTTGNLNGMTFDPVQKKLYGFDLAGVLYEVSMTDSTSTAIDTIRWQGQKVAYPMTISAAPSGSLFIIAANGFLYKVNKNTAEAEVVGAVGGESVQLAYQSATFDRLSGELYWARVGSETIDLYKVDTSTGHATFYSEFGLQTTGLFHQCYDDPCDVYPAAINNFKVRAEGRQVSFTWTNPSTNGLGTEVDCFEKIRVYRAVGMEPLVQIDSILSVTPGADASYSYTEEQDGYYRYGFQVINSKGLTSGIREEAIGLYDYTLPYYTGFESSDNNTPITADTTVKFVTDPAMVYEGNVSAFIPTFSRLRIGGLPLEKGTTYRLTFMARGYELGLVGYTELNKPFTVKPFATLNVRVDDGQKVYYPEETRSLTWAAATVDLYTDETKTYEIAFSTSIFDEYYLDNVRIETLTPNTVPGMVEQARVERDGASLAVDLHWTNPTLTAGGETLQDLGGIVVQVAHNKDFSPANLAFLDTVKTSDIGAVMQKTYTMPDNGYWYFRMFAYNQNGVSPIDTVFSAAWVGRDTVFDAPVGFQAKALSNGKIRLEWNKLKEEGSHGGNLGGNITGYKIQYRAGNSGEVISVIATDTVYETEPLGMNFYTFSLNGVRDGQYDGNTTSTRLLGGFYGGQTTVTEITGSAGYSTHPFNACTEFSDNSTVNQFIVSRQNFAEPCIIDTLYFFMEPLSIGFSQKIKIHLGYYPRDLFVEHGDWMAIDSLTEVFAGSLRFEKGAEVLKIPVKPFYYDQKRNLLVSVIKGKQTARLDARFISNTVYEYYPQIHDYHLESMSDYYDLTGKPVMEKGLAMEPLLVVNRQQNLNTVKGHITLSASGEAAEGAKIEIVKTEDSQGMDFSQTLYCDRNGDFSFGYFPDNTYRIHISYSGMQDLEREVTLAGGQVEDIQVALQGASKINLNGYVRNRLNEPVAGAVVTLLNTDAPEAVSAEDGTFVIADIYGSTRYDVAVRHDIYKDYNIQIRVDNELESRMDTVDLVWFPFPARKVTATETEAGGMEIAWAEPLQSLRTVERKYHGERKSSICSSAEIMAAIRFSKNKLREWGDDQPEIGVNSIAFHATDTTADYSLRIFSSNLDVPDYEQHVGYLPLSHHRIFLDEAFKIDTTHDLLVALHVARGYKGCPLGNDAGPQLNDGALIHQGDGWRYMSDYMHGAEGSNWILSAFFGDVRQAEAPAGYRLYRAKATAPGLSRWEELGRVGADTKNYTDNDWTGLSFGDYRYAVRADWFDENLSQEKTAEKSKDMNFNLTLRIQDPQQRLSAGTEIKLTNADRRYVYTAQFDGLNHDLPFENIRRDTYTVSLSDNQDIVENTVFSVASDTLIVLKVKTVGNESGVDAQINVYPNPSVDGRFSLQQTSGEEVRYEVFSSDGRLLKNGILAADNTLIDLSSCAAGIYVLKVYGKTATCQKKLVIR